MAGGTMMGTSINNCSCCWFALENSIAENGVFISCSDMTGAKPSAKMVLLLSHYHLIALRPLESTASISVMSHCHTLK